MGRKKEKEPPVEGALRLVEALRRCEGVATEERVFCAEEWVFCDITPPLPSLFP